MVNLAALDLKELEPRLLELSLGNVSSGSIRIELMRCTTHVSGSLLVKAISCHNIVNADVLSKCARTII